MTDKLPPNLLALFAPRPQLRYLPPSDHAPEDRRTARVSGIAQFVPALREKAMKAQAVAEGAPVDPDDPEPERPPTLSNLEERNNRITKKQQHQKWLVEEGWRTLYKPKENAKVRGDAFKTLFVGRLDHTTDSKDLENVFSRFGMIDRTVVIRYPAKSGPAKGKPAQLSKYAFVVFDREEDFKAAFKHGAHIDVKGRSVIVDCERGRTVANWKPRRFGGGLGGRHYTKEIPRSQGYGYGGPPSGPGFGGRGGFRGSDRGGFRGRGDGFRGRGGGYGGGRGGIGYQSNGFDGPPRGPSGGGYGGRGGDGGGYGGRGGGYDDRSRNANYEPLPPRGRYQDRDRDRDRDRDGGGGGGGGYRGHKRPHEGGGYDESRSRPRY